MRINPTQTWRTKFFIGGRDVITSLFVTFILLWCTCISIFNLHDCVMRKPFLSSNSLFILLFIRSLVVYSQLAHSSYRYSLIVAFPQLLSLFRATCQYIECNWQQVLCSGFESIVLVNTLYCFFVSSFIVVAHFIRFIRFHSFILFTLASIINNHHNGYPANTLPFTHSTRTFVIRFSSFSFHLIHLVVQFAPSLVLLSSRRSSRFRNSFKLVHLPSSNNSVFAPSEQLPFVFVFDFSLVFVIIRSPSFSLSFHPFVVTHSFAAAPFVLASRHSFFKTWFKFQSSTRTHTSKFNSYSSSHRFLAFSYSSH